MYPFTIRLMLLSKGILGNVTNCGIMCPTARLLTSTVKRFPDGHYTCHPRDFNDSSQTLIG